MPYKLIVADASPSIQKAIQLAFSASDWAIVPYDNGLELTKMIFEAHPDALLVSLTLPGMDGYTVGRFVRKQEEFRDTVLVFLKGAFETFDPQRAEGVDYDDIATKPFDSAQLAVRMKNLIDAKGEHSGFPESPIPAEAVKSQPTPSAPTPAVAPSTSAPAAPAADSGSSLSIPPGISTEDLERRLQEWLRNELGGMEREVEKRVRTQISIELKKWFAEHYIALPSKGK